MDIKSLALRMESAICQTCLHHDESSKKGISNIRIYFRASTHIFLSVIQTAGLLCHMLVKMKCLYEEKTWVASACWLYWVGNRKRPDMRSGSRVDRDMFSFTCNCYLWTIHLANGSISTLAHSFNIVQFKSKGASTYNAMDLYSFESGISPSELQCLQETFKLSTVWHVWTSLI